MADILYFVVRWVSNITEKQELFTPTEGFDIKFPKIFSPFGFKLTWTFFNRLHVCGRNIGTDSYQIKKQNSEFCCQENSRTGPF